MWIFLGDTAPSKIFVWDTQVSKVFVWDTQVRPAWWQPWANTLVYYNINNNDTNTTIYDLSWNGYHQTWGWTAAYSTETGLWRVASFNGSSYTQTTSRVNFWNDITLIALAKTTQYSTSIQSLVTQWASASTWAFWLLYNFEFAGTSYGVIGSFSWTSNIDTSALWTTPYPYTTNIWSLITATRNSSWTWKIYINGVLKNTKTLTQAPWYSAWENLQIGRWRSGWPNYFKWQFKLFIWENRCWTDQEVADYYNEIKATYWL